MLCSQEAINGYKVMWLYVMFDLPVETKAQRKRATQFRKDLLKDGFGISIPAAVIISLIIYIGGTALNIYIMDMWWEKSGRRMTGKDGVTRDISVIKKILCFLDN